MPPPLQHTTFPQEGGGLASHISFPKSYVYDFNEDFRPVLFIVYFQTLLGKRARSTTNSQ